MASQMLVFGFVNMYETLALCVEFPLVACVGGISTITTHASHLIKTPTMYVINIVLYVLSMYIYIYIHNTTSHSIIYNLYNSYSKAIYNNMFIKYSSINYRKKVA